MAGSLALRGVRIVAKEDSLVRNDAHSLKASDESFERAFDEAVPIGVLDAENERAAVFTGEEKIVECRAKTADMEVSCR